MSDREPPAKPVKVVDRLGFRFTEYPEDHDFGLGRRAEIFTQLIFLATGAALLGTLILGILTPVSVKAPISGQIAPQRVHRVFPEVRGPIIELRVRKGDVVAKGDTLAVLRVEDYAARLADLEFQKSQAERKLAQLTEDFASRIEQLDFQIRQAGLSAGEVGTSGEESRAERERQQAVAEKELKQAELMLADAEKKVRNNQTLFERGLIARDQLDESRTQREMAAADVAIKQKGLEAARATLVAGRRQDVLGNAKAVEEQRRLRSQRAAVEAERDIELATAEHEVADLGRRIQLGRTELDRAAVVSPAAGAVVTEPAAAGETVSPDAPLTEVANLDHLVLVAYVPEIYRKRILVGQQAVIKIPTYKDYEFRGTVLWISPAAQIVQAQNMYEVRLDVLPPAHPPALRSNAEPIQLLPGMTAAGDVLVDRMRAIKYVVVVKMLKRY